MIRLLAVDDMEPMHNVYSKALGDVDDIRLIGFGRNGIEAILLHHELRPDVVAMNINMPVMDGISATKMLAQLDSQARVFMHSVAYEEPNISRAYAAGAIDFLVKPVTEDELIAMIRRVANAPITSADKAQLPSLGELDFEHIEPYLDSATWVGAFLEHGRTRLHQLPFVLKIITNGELNDRAWYKAAPEFLNETIQNLEACCRELVKGQEERLWSRAVDIGPAAEHPPPRDLIPYHWYILPAYRLMTKALVRLKNCDRGMRAVRKARIPEEPTREQILEQIQAADNELKWVHNRARTAVYTFCLKGLPEHRSR